MSVRGLTSTQHYVLLVIQELTAADGYGPSYQEIADELDLRSKSIVGRAVEALVYRGYVSRLPRRSRSLTVLKPLDMPEEPEFVLSPAVAEALGVEVLA